MATLDTLTIARNLTEAGANPKLADAMRSRSARQPRQETT